MWRRVAFVPRGPTRGVTAFRDYSRLPPHRTMQPRLDDPASIAAWLAELAPPHVRGLDAYQPGKPVEELERELGITGAVKVASNESPLGPSPRAMAAIEAALPSIHFYPDAAGFALRADLARHLGVGADRVILGAGSNELVYQLVLALCEPDDEVVSHQYAFLSYRLAAQVGGRRFVAAPATAALACDV